MFTWLPGYHEATGLERIDLPRTDDDWRVSIHSGTYDVETETTPLKATGRPLSQIREAFAELPRGCKLFWHVGWWTSRDGFASPSEFMLPSSELKEVVETAAAEFGVVLEYASGDV